MKGGDPLKILSTLPVAVDRYVECSCARPGLRPPFALAAV